MNEQAKPLIVEMEEAKIELIQCVNDIMQRHGLNCYLFEPTFADMYSQIKMGARNELARARAQMKDEEAVETASF